MSAVPSNVMRGVHDAGEIGTSDLPSGKYRVLRRLEINATSEMVLAVAEGALGFERTVILKRLLPHAHADPKRARSFGCEASAYGRLIHPAIVRLYDFLTVDDMPTMVLEHVDGVSLQELILELRTRGEKLPVEAALYIGTRVFAALGAAHAACDPATHSASPVIHRDVSPGNVLIAGNADVKLSNFGFAKLEGSVITEMSMEIPKGTVGYMAPEQLLGDPITPRTDVYGGAILLRELLTGEPTFVHGDGPYVDYLQSMAKPALTPMASVRSGLPRAVAGILQAALEPDSDKRDVSAADVQRVLDAHCEGGRARLKEILARLGLARGHSGETDESSVTVLSIAQLEARARRARLAALIFASCAILLGAFALRAGMRARNANHAAVRIPSPAIAITTATAPVLASAIPAPIAPDPIPVTGELRTPESKPSHRIFIDGRFAGETGTTLTLSCGAHRVRIGGGGRVQSVVVPCGGSADVGGR